MHVQECIRSRISTRVFKPDPISHNCIEQILESGRWAPSAKNRQPWRFAVLTGAEKKRIIECCGESLKKANNNEHISINEIPSERESFQIIDQAPILILVFNIYPSHRILQHEDHKYDMTNIQSIGAAIQNMLLTATELGIKSLWICDIFSAAGAIEKLFHNAGELVAGIALGFSEEREDYRTSRLPLCDLLLSLESEV